MRTQRSAEMIAWARSARVGAVGVRVADGPGPATSDDAWWRKNRSGVAKIGRGVRCRSRRSGLTRSVAARRRGGPRCPAPGHAPPRPTARPLPGRRRHGFPRSHGPAEDEVNATWLTLRRCADLALEPRHADHIRSACNERGENAEGTRDPQESWRVRAHDAADEPGATAPWQRRVLPSATAQEMFC
jgi:hypothetical protein